MSCCAECSTTYNRTFDAKMAARDMTRYKKRGPSKSTKKLLDVIFSRPGNSGMSKTLVDIGGGIGAIGLESAAKGVETITSIDVSNEYRAVAEREVVKRGLEHQFAFYTGDVVQLSNNIDPADIVTLDKSICCYQDYTSLVETSVSMARNILGIVIPREVWWVIWINAIGNLFRQLKGDPFRTFVHPISRIQNIITNHRFTELAVQTSREWKILVFQAYGNTK